MKKSPILRLLQRLTGPQQHDTMSSEKLNASRKLEAYYEEVRLCILERQDILSGLLPASTAVNTHGDYTDAWVRDNVYSILAAWGLALAYKNQDQVSSQRYILEQSVVKLMRGLLLSMMRQAQKVERFKHTQHATDALHAKYSTRTGEPVVGDGEWGHLQLDATSLYLLMLAQMTSSGLRIVFTLDEVNFVQNLVHYISRSYRTPDYGIWERGNKLNHGEPELNASSIGLAKAALEALSGFNVFGEAGDQASIIHVIDDDIARTRIALTSLLPRESVSKEVDSALLAIVGFPAFAVDDSELASKTLGQITDKLEGSYGCKRFLLDGHQTVLEDPKRLHYEPEELQQFQRIECEWPLFFAYLHLTHLFGENRETADSYLDRLERTCIIRDGQKLVPELYYVPETKIDAERLSPGSQIRVANENIPLVWAQSLLILGKLLHEGWIEPKDIDPLHRHRKVRQGRSVRVQIALLAKDDEVKNELLQLGIRSQTAKEIHPLEIRDASILSKAYAQVGRNDRLGLTGRPLRQLRSLTTSRIYLLASTPVLFIPQFLNQKGFYLAIDNTLLVQRFRTELVYIARHWNRSTDPLIVMEVHENMLKSPDQEVLINFLQQISKGRIGESRVKLCRLSDFSERTAHEKIGYLHDFQLESDPDDASTDSAETLRIKSHFSKLAWHLKTQPWDPLLEIQSDEDLIKGFSCESAPNTQIGILTILAQRHGLEHTIQCSFKDDAEITIRTLLEAIYLSAADHHAWFILRHCAGLLEKYDIDLEQSATEILVRQHALTVGKAYSSKATFQKPADSYELLSAIKTFNPDNVSQQVLIQELIIALGLLIKENSILFKDMHTLRVGHILDMIIADEMRERGGSLDEAYSRILHLPPHRITDRLKEILTDYPQGERQLGNAESLHIRQSYPLEKLSSDSTDPFPCIDEDEDGNWEAWREKSGRIGRESELFFEGIWQLLEHCQGIVIGEKYNSQQRLDSQNIKSHMTSGEKSFRLTVTHLLDKIISPVYRQLTVEALDALAETFRQHPGIQVEDTLVIDIILGHAVRLNWLKKHPDGGEYQEAVDQAWQDFNRLPPAKARRAINAALGFLLNLDRSLE